MIVSVTAEDGSVATYQVTIKVNASGDVGLSTIIANGQTVEPNSTLNVAPGTSSLVVVGIATDPGATVAVSGNDNLHDGENTITVTVTAACGCATQDYSFTVNVLTLSNNVGLSTFTINGVDVTDGSSIDVLNQADKANVVVQTESANATYEITSSTDLEVGANTITVKVTSESGNTQKIYSVTVNRAAPLSNNTTISSITIGGSSVAVNGTYEASAGTEAVDLTVVTADGNATFVVTGNTGLRTGLNTVKVIVTAEDGTTVSYDVFVNVAKSNNTGLGSVKVNGFTLDVEQPLAFEVSSSTTSVSVVAVAADVDATVTVSGADNLAEGANDVIVTVTAADGITSQDYVIVVTRAALSSNNELGTITVNGESVEAGGTFNVDQGTTSVSVVATAADPDATVEVSGNTNLDPGANTVTVTVTAANGSSATYTFTVFVRVLSGDTSLSTFTINGEDVVEGKTIVTDGTKNFVTVVARATDANASIDVSGAGNLSIGLNTITVTVTAENGDVATYTVLVKYPDITDATLATFTINGEAVANGDEIALDYGVDAVEVVALANSELATVEIEGGSDLVSGANTVTVTVTAGDGEANATYTVTLNVAYNNDTSLATFQVNGTDVEDGGSIDLDPYTTEVEVTAEPTDPDATVDISGNTDLQTGSNTLVVTVTAANGDTQEYTVSLNVAVSTDTSLATFQVNGNDVADGDVVTLDPYTTSVEVTVETTDPNATYEIEGNTGLVVGDNVLTVSVTAADGQTADSYSVTLTVPLGNNVELASFQVNGADVADGDVVNLEYGTTEVEVAVATVDPDATYEIVGGTDLVSGENALTIDVTAADGETTAAYTVTLLVAQSNDTSLATFTVNGADVVDGDVVDLEYGTTEVEVVVVPTDSEGASFEVAGATDLVSGENTLTVTVTAADGETTAEYNVTLNVALNSDASLATFQVNGNDVADGDVVDLDPYTTSVEVTAEATDPDATVEIEGAEDLQVGENLLIVTVTAADGSGESYVVTLNVPLGNNVELATFQVNGSDVADGDVVNLDPYTTSAELTIETVDPDATFEVSGGSDLQPGENTLTVTVTAADGETTAEYNVTLVVALGNNVELATFQVNGTDVADGDVVNLDYGTTDVDVVVETVDPDATFETTGGADLQPGENALTVTVAAADGETTAEYNVTLLVALNSDASLATFTVNGSDVVDGDVVDLDFGTTEVEVVAEATDPAATVEISGGTELQPGENTLTVTVTAADGETTVEYNVTLNVALNSDASLATFTVNGADVQDGDVVNLDPYTTEVEVVAEATDPEATVEVSGATDLVLGENTLTVTVTAQDGTVAEYFVTLIVAAGTDVTLSTFTVNGNDVADGDVITLEGKATSVEVEVVTTDPDATYEISGNEGLVVGENTLTVTVTAADSTTTATYTVTMILPSSDVTLAEFTVNGSPVSDGDYFELPNGTTSVDVSVVTNDSAATYEIEGGSDLQTGENTLTVTVTAADGETTGSYTVTLFVLLNSDTSLSTFTVNGADVEDGAEITLPPYSDAVEVVATPTTETAQVDVSGADGLQVGTNVLQVTVTAEDGTVQVYLITIYVEVSTETGVSEITVDGQVALDKDVILGTDLEMTEVEVDVTTIDENATVDISGNTDLVLGDNLITITVTAPSGDSRDYTVTFRLGGLPGNAKLASLVVGGSSINLANDSSTVNVLAGTRFVPVIATAEDTSASIVVTGNKNLVQGDNTVTVTVKAADGKTIRAYTVIVNVAALSTNTKLSSIRVNGSVVTAGDTITLVAGARYAEVVAVAEDSAATVSYSGFKDLVAGNNTGTIRVTSAAGTTQDYTVTLVAPSLSNDNSLKVFTIEGFNVLGKSKLTVMPGTTKLHITAQANFSGASVSISGRDITPGSNTVTVTVTAADGSTATYTVIVKVKA